MAGEIYKTQFKLLWIAVGFLGMTVILIDVAEISSLRKNHDERITELDERITKLDERITKSEAQIDHIKENAWRQGRHIVGTDRIMAEHVHERHMNDKMVMDNGL